jgi:GNAT superfamily N-acetyltransferase
VSSFEVRPFARSDREQLTALVNAHVAAVVPGVSVSVNAVLSQLEREPGEFIVDPWVEQRLTLVAEQRQRIVAAAHLHRYGASDDVGESYRGAGVIRWFLCWPPAPYWPDAAGATDALMDACLAVFDDWGVARQYADGALPAPGVYGVPAQWPLVRLAYERAGFVQDGKTEIVFIADVDDLPRELEPPVPGIELVRSVGINGTRLTAVADGAEIGFIEVERLGDAGRFERDGGLADIGNLQVVESWRRRGVATWLVAAAGAWLRLGRVSRLLDYAWPEQEDSVAFLNSVGFRELTRTQRGWTRDPAKTTAASRRRTGGAGTAGGRRASSA